ncbi:MAG: hypothetical protein WC881_03110 [Elusimicrobiota bacterium]|jgi:hypothetical protein
MLKLIAAVLMAGAISANAQTSSDAQFENDIKSILKQNQIAAQALNQSVAKNSVQQASLNSIDRVLSAMNDLPGTGAMLTRWLRQNQALVEFSDTRSLPGPQQPLIYIAASLRSAPSAALGAAIAQAAARAMLEDFPASPEKQYLVASRTAETYFELGGARADIDSLDQQTAADIRLWVENAVEPGVNLLTRQYHEPLAKLLSDLQRDRQIAVNFNMNLELEFDERIARVEKAIQGFDQFKAYEKEWIRSFSSLVR